MGEATIGLWLVMFIFLLGGMGLIHVNRYDAYTRPNFFTTLPLSFTSVLFSFIATFLYFICAIYTDRIKKQRNPEQTDIKMRNNLYDLSMIFIVLSFIAFLLSVKYE